MKFKINPQLIKTSNGYEAWAIWDDAIGIYEICIGVNGQGYFGCEKTLAKAKKFVEKWFN